MPDSAAVAATFPTDEATQQASQGDEARRLHGRYRHRGRRLLEQQDHATIGTIIAKVVWVVSAALATRATAGRITGFAGIFGISGISTVTAIALAYAPPAAEIFIAIPAISTGKRASGGNFRRGSGARATTTTTGAFRRRRATGPAWGRGASCGSTCACRAALAPNAPVWWRTTIGYHA